MIVLKLTETMLQVTLVLNWTKQQEFLLKVVTIVLSSKVVNNVIITTDKRLQYVQLVWLVTQLIPKEVAMLTLAQKLSVLLAKLNTISQEHLNVSTVHQNVVLAGTT